MKLTVHFMGLCLFVAKDEAHSTFDVLLPDTTKDTTHPDTHPAEKHFAYLVVQEAGKPRRKVDLENVKISFESTGTPAEEQATRDVLEYLVDIHKIAEDIGIQADARETSIARVCDVPRSGLMPERDVPRHWTFGKRLKQHDHTMDRMARHVTWTRTFPNGVTVKLSNGEEIPVERNTNVYIMNICGGETAIDRAIRGEIQPNPGGSVGSAIKDKDFRWFYHLLESTDGRTLAERGGDKDLPVPETVQVHPAPGHKSMKKIDLPDTPTCLCGFFCEVENCPNH